MTALTAPAPAAQPLICLPFADGVYVPTLSPLNMHAYVVRGEHVLADVAQH